jgi:hypothetical protein
LNGWAAGKAGMSLDMNEAAMGEGIAASRPLWAFALGGSAIPWLLNVNTIAACQ